MATREERNLTDQIKQLAAQLKVEPPPTDNMNAQQLGDALAQLRALEVGGLPPQPTGAKPDTISGESSGEQRKGVPGPQTQAAPVNAETGISPVGEGGSVRTEENPIPSSEPDEIAPVPDAAGNLPRQPKPAPSSTGYRVEQGKSITSSRGELLSEGAEIGERDLAGGQERIDELVKSGHIVKTDKSSDDSDARKS